VQTLACTRSRLCYIERLDCRRRFTSAAVGLNLIGTVVVFVVILIGGMFGRSSRRRTLAANTRHTAKTTADATERLDGRTADRRRREIWLSLATMLFVVVRSDWLPASLVRALESFAHSHRRRQLARFSYLCRPCSPGGAVRVCMCAAGRSEIDYRR
jgi:hypothetical protein